MTIEPIKLSDSTLSILTKFSELNANMILYQGGLLKTKTMGGETNAIAEIPETIPLDLPIYDLRKVVRAVNALGGSECTLEFVPADKDDESNTYASGVIISNGTNKINYKACTPDCIPVAPKKTTKRLVFDCFVQVNLTQDIIKEVMNLGQLMNCDSFCLKKSADSPDIEIKAFNRKNPTASNYTSKVGQDDSDLAFTIVFDIQRLKLHKGDYTMGVTHIPRPDGNDAFMGVFTNEEYKLDYYIGALGEDVRNITMYKPASGSTDSDDD